MQAVRLTVNYFLQKKRQAGRKAESWDNNKNRAGRESRFVWTREKQVLTKDGLF